MPDEKKEKIGTGKKVRIHFTVTADGAVVESTQGKPPLYFIYGSGSVLPALQKKIQGLTEGAVAEFDLAPQEAYGPYREEALQEIPKTEFPDTVLTPGMILHEDLPGGKKKVGRIKEVRAESVVMDFNHPMAGCTLHYRIEVVSVMNA